MSDPDRWRWLIDQLGKPRPCALCGRPTPTAELTECRVPGYVIPAGRLTDRAITVDRVVWVCPACPLVDPA